MSVTRERNTRRQQILEAARRCFKNQGFHKTTLRDIAHEFGMSAGHIYNYFNSKEAIIEELVEHLTQEFISMIGTDAFAHLPPEKRQEAEIGTIVDAYLDLDNSELSLTIMNEALINPKVYDIVVKAATQVRSHIIETYFTNAPGKRDYMPPMPIVEARVLTIRAMLEGMRLTRIFNPNVDVSVLREMAVKRIIQLVKIDEAEDAEMARVALEKAEALQQTVEQPSDTVG